MQIATASSSSAAVTASNNSNETPQLVEKEDGIYVEINNQSHKIETEHCGPCVDVVGNLQAKADEGDQGAVEMLGRVQEQMETLQKAQLDQRAESDPNAVGYAAPVKEESVALSGTARRRFANLARAAAARAPVSKARVEAQDSASQNQPTQESPSSEEASEASASKKDDHAGHGHGESEATHNKSAPGGHHSDLTEADLEEIQKLSARDAEVRAHEQAHKSAAGSHGGAISLSYKQGPDGKRYAVEGEVPVDMSSVSGDPEATLAKMRQIQRAALAPAEPSSADRRVAARAAQKAAKAQREIMKGEDPKENPLKEKFGKDNETKASEEGSTASTTDSATNNEAASSATAKRNSDIAAQPNQPDGSASSSISAEQPAPSGSEGASEVTTETLKQKNIGTRGYTQSGHGSTGFTPKTGGLNVYG